MANKLMPQNSRSALVTGGSRGIGLGIARMLLASGYNVAINGVRPTGDIGNVLAEFAQYAGDRRVIYVQGDVAKLDDHARMLNEVRQAFGRLDALINNAGVAANPRADILEATSESFDRLIGINLRGPYFLTQAAARWMVAQKQADSQFRGCIVNVSSISATAASTNRGDYCISKAGIIMATQLWAARLAEFGIDVYEVRPGIIATDMTAGVKEKYDRLIAEGLTIDKRWGTAEDVGKAVAALVRGDIPYATGQVLNIDGGMTIQRL